MIPATSYQNLVHQYQFWLYLCCVIVAWSGLATTVTMSDTICFQLLESNANLYGEQRMWGSIGWGMFVVIAGALIDYASKGQVQKDYTSSFVLVLAILIIDILVASRLKVIIIFNTILYITCSAWELVSHIRNFLHY